MAVRASSAIPGLVQPYTINGKDYVDGGLVSRVPVKVARQLGADIVIAVDVSRNPLKPHQLQSTLAVMQQAIIIMSHKIAETEIGEAEILIRPEVSDIAISGFEDRQQAVQAGESSALKMLVEIKRHIELRTQYIRF